MVTFFISKSLGTGVPESIHEKGYHFLGVVGALLIRGVAEARHGIQKFLGREVCANLAGSRG